MTTKATKDFLQAKTVSVQKTYGECEKVERHQAGNNWQKNWSFVRAQLSHYKVDFKKSAGNRNEQSRTKNEQTGVFRSVGSIHQQDSNLWVLAWLHKTKVNKIW